MLKKIDKRLIQELLEDARKSPRKRIMYNLHKDTDILQRMINVALKDSYYVPHKHIAEDKCELFAILKGKVAILEFDDKGNITDKFILDSETDNKVVEIRPNTWHTLVILSDVAVLFEIILGRYDPKSHKTFAPFAPTENTDGSSRYLKKLRSQLE